MMKPLLDHCSSNLTEGCSDVSKTKGIIGASKILQWYNGQWHWPMIKVNFVSIIQFNVLLSSHNSMLMIFLNNIGETNGFYQIKQSIINNKNQDFKKLMMT